ncbi:GMC oxidoreductase [Dulcicalothrix desertica]|nr:GMC oxidoreductase [Dulcicalothrix desertica]
MHMNSRGTVSLRSSAAYDPPLVDPGYLTAPEDLQMCKTALQF